MASTFAPSSSSSSMTTVNVLAPPIPRRPSATAGFAAQGSAAASDQHPPAIASPLTGASTSTSTSTTAPTTPVLTGQNGVSGNGSSTTPAGPIGSSILPARLVRALNLKQPTESFIEREIGLRRRFGPLVYSYMLEWALIIVLILVPLAIAVYLIPFRTRAVSLLDASIQQPYIGADSLKIALVASISAFGTIFIIALYPWLIYRYQTQFGVAKHEFSWWYFGWWLSSFVQSAALTVLLSELSKRLLQVPRPDFLSRCFPEGVPAQIHANAVANNYIFNTELCTPTDTSTYEDGLQSMPSEHTSLTWCMMTIFLLFVSTLRRELLAARRTRFHGENSANTVTLVAQMNDVAARPRHGRTHSRRMVIRPDSERSLRKAATPHRGSTSNVVFHPNGAVAHGHALAEPKGPFVDVELGGESPLRAPAAEDPSACVSSGDESPSSNPSSPITRHEDALVEQPTIIIHDASSPCAEMRPPSFWPVSHVVAILHFILPLGWAVAVSLSRAFDHRHAPIDILVGALIGVGIAMVIFSLHRTQFGKYHERWGANKTFLDREEEAAAHEKV